MGYNPTMNHWGGSGFGMESFKRSQVFGVILFSGLWFTFHDELALTLIPRRGGFRHCYRLPSS